MHRRGRRGSEDVSDLRTFQFERGNTVPPTSHRIWPILCGLIIAVVCIGHSLGVFSESSATSQAAQDEVSPHVKAYIDRAIARAQRDAVGRRDYALIADGARVVRALTGAVSDRGFIQDQQLANNSPDSTLVDDLRIGNCWTIAAAKGQLGIRLSEQLYPTHVTVDHIPVEIAADITRAPRTLILWGAVDGTANTSRLQNTSMLYEDIPNLRGRSGPHETANHTFIPLSIFEYDIRSATHVQTFPIRPHIVDLGFHFGVVVLEVATNWGGQTTCLYRVRVHGHALGHIM